MTTISSNQNYLLQAQFPYVQYRSLSSVEHFSLVTSRHNCNRNIPEKPEISAENNTQYFFCRKWDHLHPVWDRINRPSSAGNRWLYVTMGQARDQLRLEKDFIQPFSGTSINWLMLDGKNEQGAVSWCSDVPLIREVQQQGVSKFHTGNPASKEELRKNIAMLQAAGFKVSLRICVFQDETLAELNPEYAILDSSTGRPWNNGNGLSWIDPCNTAYREQYLKPLVEEALALGIDKLVLDYIRWPSDGMLANCVYPAKAPDVPVMSTTVINETVAYVSDLVHAQGKKIQGLCFGYAAQYDIVGQSVRFWNKHLDEVTPMTYPSHYTHWLIGKDNFSPFGPKAETVIAGLVRDGYLMTVGLPDIYIVTRKMVDIYKKKDTAALESDYLTKDDVQTLFRILDQSYKGAYGTLYATDEPEQICAQTAWNLLRRMAGGTAQPSLFLQGFEYRVDDFDMIYLLRQIKAAEDAGITSWGFWNPKGDYSFWREAQWQAYPIATFEP